MVGISAVWNPLCTWVSAPCSCMLCLYCWGAAQKIFVVSICPDLWPLVYPSRLMSLLLPSGGEVSIKRKLPYTFIFPGVGVLVYKWNCWGSCPQMTGKCSVRTVSQLRREWIEGANFPRKLLGLEGAPQPAIGLFALSFIYLPSDQIYTRSSWML